MARKQASLKALRQARRRALHNDQLKRQVRDGIRKFRKALSVGKSDDAKKALRDVQSRIDRAVKSKTFHRATAARIKSRLSQAIKKIAKKS
jgi:small subunit ribosomal protein S20